MKTEEDLRRWWNGLDRDIRVLVLHGHAGHPDQHLISGLWDELSSDLQKEAMMLYSRVVGGNQC
jgi:hypothetical protein